MVYTYYLYIYHMRLVNHKTIDHTFEILIQGSFASLNVYNKYIIYKII